jgi:hypothetical protein
MIGGGIELSDYYTKEEIDSKGYITSLEGYAKLTDIPDTTNFATKDELYDDTALASRVTVVETSLQGVESIL